MTHEDGVLAKLVRETGAGVVCSNKARAKEALQAWLEEYETTGEIEYPKLELVRLAIPRRVYTQSHLNYIADAIIKLYNNREKIRGLKIIYEAPFLRHFTVKLKEI